LPVRPVARQPDHWTIRSWYMADPDGFLLRQAGRQLGGPQVPTTVSAVPLSDDQAEIKRNTL
jgi:hypothetical protein